MNDEIAREMRARRLELVATLVREGNDRDQACDVPNPFDLPAPKGLSKRGALEEIIDPSSVQEFRESCAHAGFDAEAEVQRALINVARRGAAPREDERTGLPCPDCDRKQKRLQIERTPDGGLSVRVAYPIPAGKVASEVKALIGLIQSFAR